MLVKIIFLLPKFNNSAIIKGGKFLKNIDWRILMEEIKQIMEAEKQAEDLKNKAIEDRQTVILAAEEEGTLIEQNIVKEALELKEREISSAKKKMDEVLKEELLKSEKETDELIKSARGKMDKISEDIVGRIVLK